MPFLFDMFAPHSPRVENAPEIADACKDPGRMATAMADTVLSANKASLNVSFCPSVVVYTCISREDLSEEEIKQCWFTREELHRIHLENVETIWRMRSGSFNFTDDFCARGLESRTAAGAHRRLKTRIDGLQAVLEYQELEKKSGRPHDPLKMAQLYAKQTEEPVRIACLMASIDAQSASQGETVESTKKEMMKPLPRTPERFFRRLSSSECRSPVIVRVL
jgi:hypothetical protein